MEENRFERTHPLWNRPIYFRNRRGLSNDIGVEMTRFIYVVLITWNRNTIVREIVKAIFYDI